MNTQESGMEETALRYLARFWRTIFASLDDGIRAYVAIGLILILAA